MLEQNAFDNICPDHREYYSVTSLKPLIEKYGLEIFDVELYERKGGSMRFDCDWSSDVCSSDLQQLGLCRHRRPAAPVVGPGPAPALVQPLHGAGARRHRRLDDHGMTRSTPPHGTLP